MGEKVLDMSFFLVRGLIGTLDPHPHPPTSFGVEDVGLRNEVNDQAATEPLQALEALGVGVGLFN
jgi:hypothetical protein